MFVVVLSDSLLWFSYAWINSVITHQLQYLWSFFKIGDISYLHFSSAVKLKNNGWDLLIAYIRLKTYPFSRHTSFWTSTPRFWGGSYLLFILKIKTQRQQRTKILTLALQAWNRTETETIPFWLLCGPNPVPAADGMRACNTYHYSPEAHPSMSVCI